MIKVEIELDRQKIIDDGKYSPESILECMDDAFLRRGQQILEADGFRRVYRDSGNTEKDFALLGGVVLNLVKVEWFGNYVSKIMWYNSDNGKDENDFYVEDFLANIKKNKFGVFAEK